MVGTNPIAFISVVPQPIRQEMAIQTTQRKAITPDVTAAAAHAGTAGGVNAAASASPSARDIINSAINPDSPAHYDD